MKCNPLLAAAVAILLATPPAVAQLKLGYIGTDTSHVIAFTKVFNDPANPDHVPGGRVVAAYKGGSPDIKESASRVDGYATQLEKDWKVEIVPDIASLVAKVDAIMLESVDGRQHLQQFKEIVKTGAKKPVFIDKPLASTFEDAREIARLAKQAGIPWFSASSLRWSEMATTMKFADAKSVLTWGPGPEEEHHYLDLSWYAVHPIEVLYTIMGPGCVEVSRTASADGDMIVGKWKDGRLGSVRTTKPYGDYGAIVFRTKTAEQSNPKMKTGYPPMLKELMRFFQTKELPVPNEVTLEMFAFMDAAQRSKLAAGKPQTLR